MAAADVADTAFFPLTMPFTVGPGSVSVGIALSAERPQAGGIAALLWFGAAVTAAAALVCVTVWIAHAGSQRVVRLLGRSGARIVTRLLSLILLCIGVQIVAWGVQDIVLPMLGRAPG